MGKKSDKEILKDIFNKIWDRYAGNLQDGLTIGVDISERLNSADITIWEAKHPLRIIYSAKIYLSYADTANKDWEEEFNRALKKLDTYKKIES